MRRFTQIVLLLLVGLVLLLPVIEGVDFWDNLAVTGQDLELTEISLLTLVGFVLSFRFVWHALQQSLLSLREGISVSHRKPRYLPRPVCFNSVLPHDLPNQALSLRI